MGPSNIHYIFREIHESRKAGRKRLRRKFSPSNDSFFMIFSDAVAQLESSDTWLHDIGIRMSKCKEALFSLLRTPDVEAA